MTEEALAVVRRAFESLVVGMRSGDTGVLLREPWTYLATEGGGRVVRFEAYLDPADARP